MKLLLTYILPLLLLSSTVLSQGNPTKTGTSNNGDTIVYQIDIEKSKLLWYCDLHNGHVFLDSGHIAVHKDEIVAGRFVICMESIIDIDIDDYELMRITLENTLKSIEFFNTAMFRHSFFIIDHAEKSEKGYHITGELDLMNVAQCINFDAEFEFNNNELVATSDSIVVNRTHWGITSMTEDDAKSNQSFIVPNHIGIVVHLVAFRE